MCNKYINLNKRTFSIYIYFNKKILILFDFYSLVTQLIWILD